MTIDDQIKAAAELDGWIPIREEEYPHRNGFTKGEGFDCFSDLPDYPNSFDAIIPLIQKIYGSGDYLEKGGFFQHLRGVMEKQYENPFSDYWHIFNICLMCSPAQLLEALLRATGKWTS